jgi:tetratricopeptide (TPR) repeat protein
MANTHDNPQQPPEQPGDPRKKKPQPPKTPEEEAIEEILEADAVVEVSGPQRPGSDADINIGDVVVVAGGSSDILVVDSSVPKGPPSDSGKVKLGEGAEVIEGSSDIVVVESPSGTQAVELVETVEEPGQPAESAGESTQKKGVAPTMLSTHSPAPTMLAGEQDLEALAAEALEGEAPKGAPEAPVGEEASTEKRAAPPTRIGGKAPAPTMLAGQEEVEGLPATPALEIDSGKKGDSGKILDVTDADVVEAGEAVEVVEPSGEEVLGKAKKQVKDDSGMSILEEEVLVEGGSEITPGKKPGEGRSAGVDMIAEALESGVDLSAEKSGVKVTPAKKPGRRLSEVDLGGDAGVGSGSGIDYGGPEEEAKTGESDTGVEEVIEEAAEVVEEEVVVGGKTKMGTKTTELDEAVADDDLFAAPAKGAAVDEEKPPAKQKPKKEPAKGGAGKLVGGLLGGFLVALIAFALVWAVLPGLLESLPESPLAPGKRWQAAAKGGPAPVAPQLSKAQEARALLDDKKYDEALEMLKDEEGKPEKQVRGEARWFKYVEQQKAKKAPLQMEDKDVKDALKDLTDAENVSFTAMIVETIQADDLRKQLKEVKGGDKGIEDLHKFLVDSKQLAPNTPKTPEAVKKVVGELATSKGQLQWIADNLKVKVLDIPKALEALAGAQKAVDALAAHFKVNPQDLPKAVGALQAAKADADKQLAVVNDALKTAGTAGGAKGVQELVMAREALVAQKKALDNAIALALKELKEGGALPPGKDALQQLVEGTKAMRLKGDSPLGSSMGQMFSALSGLGAGAGKLLDRAFGSASAATQLAAARAREALSEAPEQRLDTLAALLQNRDRIQPADLAAASKYLEWVGSPDSKVGPELRAKARFVVALAQRNAGRHGEAVKSLQQVLKEAAALKTAPPWAADAGRTLKELTDPQAYYLPRVQALRDQSQFAQALKELDGALQALPGDGRLLAMRGLVRLDMASAKVGPEVEKEVRQDAEAALKDAKHAAEGLYVLGRLEEQLGQLDKAEQHYRKGLEVHTGTPDEARHLQRALADLLLRDTWLPPPPAPAPKKAAETSRLAPSVQERQDAAPVVADPRAALLVLVMTGLQPPAAADDPELEARLKQVLKLAEDMINSPNPKVKGEGHMLRAQVFARQGKRNEGLFEYVKGLELFHPGKTTKELAKMVNEHPAFQLPDALMKPNALLAERHYGRGLQLYWQRKYAEAEEELRKAVQFFDQDARYVYFLALSRYQQKSRAKRDAADFDFSQAARLEAMNRPHTTEVNASLERVQGELRQVLNSYRQKGAAAPN